MKFIPMVNFPKTVRATYIFESVMFSFSVLTVSVCVFREKKLPKSCLSNFGEIYSKRWGSIGSANDGLFLSRKRKTKLGNNW